MQDIVTVINGLLKQDIEDDFADAAEGEEFGVLKIGRLQDDPEEAHIAVTLHRGNPDDPDNWGESVFARRDHALDRSQFEAQTWEVGGGSMWWVRGAVLWSLFGTLTGEDREEAERKAGVIQARIKRAIAASTRVPGSTDDFGTVVVLIHPVISTASEGGGPPNEFIWRGKVLWQALVQQQY